MQLLIENLLNYEEVFSKWQKQGADFDSAVIITKEQVAALEKIVNDDRSWEKLIEISMRGRVEDAWLAQDWPEGFDELVVCVPLCKLVEWECAKCTIGSRQKNFSCSHDNSLFGYIGTLVSNNDREGLVNHLQKVKLMLEDFSLSWDPEKPELVSSEK